MAVPYGWLNMISVRLRKISGCLLHWIRAETIATRKVVVPDHQGQDSCIRPLKAYRLATFWGPFIRLRNTSNILGTGAYFFFFMLSSLIGEYRWARESVAEKSSVQVWLHHKNDILAFGCAHLYLQCVLLSVLPPGLVNTSGLSTDVYDDLGQCYWQHVLTQRPGINSVSQHY